MKNLLLAVLAFAMIVFIGCSSMGKVGKESLLGKWEGTAPNGDNVINEFTDEDTLIATFSGSQNITFTGKTRIDFSTSPISIDIFDFDLGPLTGVTGLGIIQLGKNDKMLFQVNMIQSGESGSRPTEFNDEVFKFTRKK